VLSRARTVERLVPLRELARAEVGGRRRGASRAYDTLERPELAARGVGEILDTAWDVLASRFAACVGVAFALTFPARLALIALDHSGLATTTRDVSGVIVHLLIELLTAVLLANFVRDRLAGRPGSVTGSVRAVLDRFVSLAATLVVLALIQGCTTVLLVCCFPVLFLVQWQLSVVPAVYAIERTSLFAALRRGSRLVRGWGNFGRWLGWYLVQIVMFVGLTGLTEALDEPRVRAMVLEHLPLGPLAFDALGAIPIALVLAVAAAYPAVTMTVYYFDTRVRGEAYDLEVKLATLRESADDRAAAAAAGGLA
jgi:hypothetical protein